MGQYFYIVNLDKKEFLHPHKFGDGLKLLEFGCSSYGTLLGLTLLLRQSTESGGGDYSGSDSNIGGWAGDRIVIIGDYDTSGIYQDCANGLFKDVSDIIIPAIKEVRENDGIKECEMEGCRENQDVESNRFG